LGVQSNLILITSEKLKIEFNGLHYTELDKSVKELMGKALEGVTDVAAWSMEMRMKNQQLAGGVAAVGTEDRLKELTGLITRLVLAINLLV
jgi:hypothetical protein